MTERDWISLTVYGEARGESTAGKLAVASVLRNRLVAGHWGSSYASVCSAPKQFSCWNATDPNLSILAELRQRVEAGENVSLSLNDPALRECYWIADGLLSGALRPQVKGALHYYSTSMQTPPSWAKSGAVVATIGHHVFLEHVAA